jgi:uncharacterized protein (DUF169 family)
MKMAKQARKTVKTNDQTVKTTDQIGSLEKNQKLNSIFNEYLRTLTFPVAVKIIKKGEALPNVKARIPMENFHHPVAICQGITMARKHGFTLIFRKEDQACPLANVILGYVEEPEIIKDGSVVYPLYVRDLDAGKRTQESTPKMPNADTEAIVIAPLHRADFDADVLIIYANAAQVTRMVQGALYNEGGYIESRFAGRGACGGEITVPYAQQKHNIIIPGGGEKVFALTQDDELAFAIPAAKIESLTEGIVATHKGGVARIPTPVAGVNIEPAFPEYYKPLIDYCNSVK